MSKSLSGSMARIALTALKEASGPQYPKILQAAGLARYQESLPPEGADPAISPAEVALVQQTAYRMLGDDLFRLFHRNLGLRTGAGVVQSAWGRQMVAQAANIPDERRLAWFVAEYAALAEQGWGHYDVTEDSTAWYLAAARCLECPDIQGTSAPICATTDLSLKTAAEAILGRRLRVEEVACRAMGAPACKHAIYK